MRRILKFQSCKRVGRVDEMSAEITEGVGPAIKLTKDWPKVLDLWGLQHNIEPGNSFHR